MTVTVKEIIGHRRYSEVNLVGSATIRYLVVGDSTTPILNEQAAIAETGVVLGSKHPQYGGVLPALDVTAQSVRDHPHAWTVDWTYRRPDGGGNVDPQDEPLEPNKDKYVETRAIASGEFVDVWRTSATAYSYWWETQNFNHNKPDDTDIGGEKVDSYGLPVSAFHRTMTYEVENVTKLKPNLKVIGASIGKRGFLEWGPPGAKFPAHTMLFKGAEVTRISKLKWRVVYSFVYDDWRHLRQIAKRDASGVIITPPEEHADMVFWRQPFPETMNFDALDVSFSQFGSFGG